MIQNIYTYFDTEYKKQTKKKTNKNKQKTTNKKKKQTKEKTLFVQLSICSNTYVKLPQRRPYTASTITVAK